VSAISTRPSEPKSRLDRAAFLRFFTAFPIALATIAGLVRSAVLAPVRTWGHSSPCAIACAVACAIFGSSAAARAAERMVSESQLLLKCRRDGCRTFAGEERGEGGRRGRLSGIRAPTAQKSEPSGSLQSARAAGGLAVGVAIGVAMRPPPLRKPPFFSSSARARERWRKGEGSDRASRESRSLFIQTLRHRKSSREMLAGWAGWVVQFVGASNRSAPNRLFGGLRARPNFQRLSSRARPAPQSPAAAPLTILLLSLPTPSPSFLSAIRVLRDRSGANPASPSAGSERACPNSDETLNSR
jgi:hypothetical protein